MTIEEAIKLDNQLKQELNQISSENSFVESAGAWLMDHHVTILTDDDRKGVITLGRDTVSYKPGNICFDLKSAALATAEYAAGFSIPDSKYKAIQMLLLTAFWIVKSVRIKITGYAADLLQYMSDMDLFEKTRSEEEIIEGFQKWYANYHGTLPTKRDVTDGILMLAECKCIRFEGGMITLCEKIWVR